MTNTIINLLLLSFILNNYNNKYTKCISYVKNKYKIQLDESNKMIKFHENKNFNKTKCINYKNPLDNFIDSKVAMAAYPLAFNFKF